MRKTKLVLILLLIGLSIGFAFTAVTYIFTGTVYITANTEDFNELINSRGYKTGRAEVELLKASIDDFSEQFRCTITVHAAERS